MSEVLEKLRPDRDLQCYFERPSAIAAISEASGSGFILSGCWRQQFDWAVIEWNRDNVFEHPAVRNLPDGDLSGLQLSYEEERSNCIALDSNWYPTVDWPYLRVWAQVNGADQIFKVKLADHATPIEGTSLPASATFELQGTPTTDDYVELAWLDEHYTYRLYGTDTLVTAAQALVDAVNAFSTTMTAERSGAQITLHAQSCIGSNANRIGVYANVAGAGTENWHPRWQTLSGGTSPSKWKITLDFSSLTDIHGASVPMGAVRKLRWTYAAHLQSGAFVRSEFRVVISNWTVSGTNREYSLAGPGSIRIEDNSTTVSYGGQWATSKGNFSGGSIHYTNTPGAFISCSYTAPREHFLYLGTRKAESCGSIVIAVDGRNVRTEGLHLAGEDVLLRVPLGRFSGGITHTVLVTNTGQAASLFYFDFLEAVVPATTLPVFPADPVTTLATDWDTDHSIALAPERTAWLIQTLGFRGRANHYAGALWFYELCRPGHEYASAAITFNGNPEFNKTTQIWLGETAIQHVSLIGDTCETVAKAFEFLINQGSTGVWACAENALLTIRVRTMGTAGNGIRIEVATNSDLFGADFTGPTAGGIDGDWRTDLGAMPRLNRAARDWHRSFFRALKNWEIEVTSAFSMELQHGDPSPSVGIAQRYPDGSAVWLNTPALQTNFSPASGAFWKQVYLDMANVLAESGQRPYLQFGEVQWWYFPLAGAGMTFYDDHTSSTFLATYGRGLPVFEDGNVAPASYPDECSFLAGLIGSFTDEIMDFVRQSHENASFEVLYPPDVNDTPLNGAVNLPRTYWTPAKLDCLKTENFTFTGDRDLNKAYASVMLPMELGFPAEKSAHLVGISDYTTPWEKEARMARQANASVVLFALDQFCLIGYPNVDPSGRGRSLFLGR
jgi:hypothetical protein